ncbi:MAG: TonB-dependent receptor [Bacteroidales bacterium]
MKIFLFLSFLGIVNATASVFPQNGLVNLDLKDVSVYTAVNEIASQTGHLFIINESESDSKDLISVRLQNATLEESMNKVLQNIPMEYSIVENYILLTPVENTRKNFANEVQPQDDKKIRGKVTYKKDQSSLPGVNVYIKGTTAGTATDANGAYELKIPADAKILVFSLVGMKTVEITYAGQEEINVVLEDENIGLDELVVVGYGTESKRLITGSVGAINTDNIKEVPVQTLDGAMAGKTTGVYVYQNSGTPGAGMSVRIRGNSSITAGNQPLYVIDGVPMVTGDYGQIGFSGQGINAVSDLNPNDIESISILKDASATAIYGARATNGVVLITTKKGKSEKTSIRFNSYYGIQQPVKLLEMMNAKEWKIYRNELKTNEGGLPIFSDENIAKNEIDTDWLDEVFRTSSIASIDLSASGGNEKTNFYVGGTYSYDEGILIGTDFQRFSGRINLDHWVSKWLKIGTSLGLSNSINNRVEGDQSLNGPLPNAITLPSIYPVYNPDGTYNEDGPYANPVSIAEQSTNQANSFRNLGNAYLDIHLLEGLTFKTKFGLDYLDLNEHSYDPITTRQGERYNGVGISAGTRVTNLMTNNMLDYLTTINNIHNLEAMLGYSFEKFVERSNFIRGTDFPNENFQYLVSAANITDASSSYYEQRTNSFFGRFKYNYNNRYLFAFTARYDGSSKFGPNNKYGLFPAASVAWRISEEAFFNVDAISDFKFRASYGLTGNDGIPSFSYMGLYTGSANYNNEPGIRPSQLPNPDLKWESTSQLNFGLDMAFLKDRIIFNTDVYAKKTKDLLLDRPISGTSGFTYITANIGELQNMGFELGLTTDNIKKSHFNWKSVLNYSMNRNKVTKLYNGQPLLDIGRGNNSVIEGQPLGVFYGYESLGVDPSTGDIVFKDINGDGEITSEDRDVIGDPNPDFIGGFNNILTYKQFTFTFFMQFTYGNDIFNGSRIYIESLKGEDNQLKIVDERWQQPGDRTNIPRATLTDPNNNNRESSRFIEDGSYLRFKEVSLSYTFAKHLTDKLHIASLKVYFTSRNLFTFTNYSGMDPEVNYAGDDILRLGTDFFTYPQARSFIFGISLGI